MYMLFSCVSKLYISPIYIHLCIKTISTDMKQNLKHGFLKIHKLEGQATNYNC